MSWQWKDGELDGLRGAQEAHMLDTCLIWAYTSLPDGYGLAQPIYRHGEPVVCGYNEGGRPEVQAVGHVPSSSATLRLPVGTVIQTTDRVQITHRNGEELTLKPMYEVGGLARLGASGLQVSLILVTE